MHPNAERADYLLDAVPHDDNLVWARHARMVATHAKRLVALWEVAPHLIPDEMLESDRLRLEKYVRQIPIYGVNGSRAHEIDGVDTSGLDATAEVLERTLTALEEFVQGVVDD